LLGAYAGFLFRCYSRPDLTAQLRAGPVLDASTRAAALRIAEQRADRPQSRRLRDASWEIVRSPGRDAQDYQRALQWAELGSRLGPAPDDWTLIVLGAASYRAGRFQDAWDALNRAEPLLSVVPGRSHAVHHVFRAMTLLQLLREAQALIDPKTAAMVTGERPAHPDKSP
jgi:hypothetical protein